MAADSLGMLLLSKTGYGSTAVPQLYDLLDSAEMLSTKCSIQSFFKKENIAADDNWFITRKKMSFGAPEKKEIRDTLKTHPDCAARKINARQYFSKNPKPGADFIFATSSQFNKTREMASLAAATYSKDKEQLSYYLYQLIQNDAVFLPGNYIKTEIFSLWVNFYFRLKNHTLGYVIDKPYIPENEKDEYAKLLQMLDDIDLKKMKEIATSYYEKNKNYIAPDTELLTNYNLLKQSLK